MADFEKEYKKLNDAQKKAVDSIYGPMVVVAGPGTGKTQLLSMRVANILRQADVMPRNILCLTFTESAAMAMKERLLGLIGSDAHKAAIHTFHSFGVEVINQYPEYFYGGAQFSPADEVLQIEIVESLLRSGKHNNPLASTMNGKFVYISSILKAIENLKKAGVDPCRLEQYVKENEAGIEAIEPVLRQAFDLPRLSKKHIPSLKEAAGMLPTESETASDIFGSITVLARSTLISAIDEAEASGKTTTITAWRNQWMEKNSRGQLVLKDRKRNQKFSALIDIYKNYQKELEQNQKFDFADMILQVLTKLKRTDELRYSLQEQYHFILVDEFQDTNGAQLRLLYQLLDNPVHEGKPDVMVVGDDDQAIYKFQGAEVNNIVNFYSTYPSAETVTLTENYRSGSGILELSEAVIKQGEARLENLIGKVSKKLTAAKHDVTGNIVRRRFPTSEHEYAWVAKEASRLIKSGANPKRIAILGRQHSDLKKIMPFLKNMEIPVTYDRRANILDDYHISQLIDMARVVHFLAINDQQLANEYLAKVLNFPFWETKPETIWRLSRRAHEERKLWLEVMLEGKNEYLQQLAKWWLSLAGKATAEPLEYVLDALIGSAPVGKFKSPYRKYYFSNQRFKDERGEYVTFLSALRLLRQSLWDYRNKETIYIRDFIDFIDTLENNNLSLIDETAFVSHDSSVQVMTAHKAKGLEFETVFVLSCQERLWAKSGSRRLLPAPNNLAIEPAGDNFDDQLRLFFVAITRAESSLFLTGYTHDEKGKESLIVPWLEHDKFIDTDISTRELPELLETSWQPYSALPKESDAWAVLKPVLENFQLNVTGLIKFLDVSRAGPQVFLLDNLLRFPQAQTPSAAYGSAVHATINYAYGQVKQGLNPTQEEILAEFKKLLISQRLKKEDHDKYLARGQDQLEAYLKERQEFFKPEHMIEVSFSSQSSVVGDARLGGRIDKMVLDKESKTCSVYDFKTGKPLKSFASGRTSEAIKSWRYKTQLVFYKLLVENSRVWSDFKVEKGVLEFIEPIDGKIILLEHDISQEEVDKTSALIQAVWKRVQNLEFPDISGYTKDLAGISKFEEDLLA